jgi:hypothetical protein
MLWPAARVARLAWLKVKRLETFRILSVIVLGADRGTVLRA